MREFQKNIYLCFTDYTKAFNCVDHNKPWKIFKEMGVPDHLLRNLYAGQEATVRTRHETMVWFKIGKGVRQGYILSPYLFYLYAEYIIIWNARLDEAQARLRLPGEISISSDIQMTLPYGRKWRGTEEPLDESERGEWKAGLKLYIQKTMIMAFSPITSWQIDEVTMETVTDFIFGGSKSLQMVSTTMKLKDACSLEEKLRPT